MWDKWQDFKKAPNNMIENYTNDSLQLLLPYSATKYHVVQAANTWLTYSI